MLPRALQLEAEGDPRDELFSRYMRLLGVAPRPPGLGALAELVGAHVARIPFENVSKLYFRHDPAMRLPPLARYLDGIEHWRCGGTCYANNIHLVRLLAHLGYDVRLCGADMTVPDVHAVGIVRLSGREYLVDAGYGAPLFTPLPLDLVHDLEIELGDESWVLKPRDETGRPRLVHLREGRPRHGYLVNPAARGAGEFAPVINASFDSDAVFMKAIVIARFAPGRSRVLHNLDLVECAGRTFRRAPVGCDAAGLPALVEGLFGIPAEVVRAALDGIVLDDEPFR